MIWFHAPHLPVVAGPKYAALYPGATRYERNYFGCVTALDEQMGRLRADCAGFGVADNTMLWFCSDNGPESSRPARTPARPARSEAARSTTCGRAAFARARHPRMARGHQAAKSRERALRHVGSAPDRSRLPAACLELARSRTTASACRRSSPAVTERPQPIGFEYGNMAAWLDNRYKLVALLKDAPTSGPANPPKQVARLLLFEVRTDPKEEKDVSTLRGRRPSRRCSPPWKHGTSRV